MSRSRCCHQSGSGQKERRRVKGVLAAHQLDGAAVESLFETPSQLTAYAGLVPWVQNSNEKIHHGRITKCGPNELRTALVQVVLGMVRNKHRIGSYRIMVRYDRLKKSKGSGRSIIATARVLSEIIWYILERNELFDEARMNNPDIRRKAMEMQMAAFDAA